MRKFLSVLLLTVSLSSAAFADANKDAFVVLAKRIESPAIQALPVQHNGRIKPLHTFARETLMFLSGRHAWWGLDPVQTYLGMVTQESAADLEIIEVRDPDLRVELGFAKEKRFFSLKQLETTALGVKARPLMAKEEQNSRLLTPSEKKVLETFHQMNLARGVFSGEHLLRSLDFSFGSPSAAAAHGSAPAGGPHGSQIQEAAIAYLRSVATGAQDAASQAVAARELASRVSTTPVPAIMERYRGTVGTEVLYNKIDPFFFTALVYVLCALLMAFPQSRAFLGRKGIFALLGSAMALHAAGFAVRVYITGFAPVTNMYGTMLWVSFGVALFSAVLHAIYDKPVAGSLLTAAAGLVLLLTHNMPLILSPDMDPIVAVLRSNFWLTIHVLTITISYAAFTIAMLLGNTALVRSLWIRDDSAFCKTYSHLAYRMIQLGVFLISAGIILGGVWADYSWGRFWGWDPKETWALIADLGFLVILHARYVGWLKDFGILATSTIAYLLVIMAWYGVNFVLAAGLHSYGFSSGGTTLVASFVIAQLALLAAAALRRRASTATA